MGRPPGETTMINPSIGAGPDPTEMTAGQYNSLILEKALADRSEAGPRFVQFFPSSELTASWAGPGLAPASTHRAVRRAA
jgi:hypothetical protein